MGGSFSRLVITAAPSLDASRNCDLECRFSPYSGIVTRSTVTWRRGDT